MLLCYFKYSSMDLQMNTPQKQITVVGPKEILDFPELGLCSVPAKVDTGADSSAIWASNIHEKNGVLYYTLFDRMSPFYTGEVLSTKKFSTTSVKNSFGHTEFRYKVSLKVTIAGRTVNVRFTLANREKNRFPLLIGRRTLHGKFLVDVAATGAAAKPGRLLLMSTRITPSVTKFVQGVQQAAEGLEIVHATYSDVQFCFGERGTHITLRATGEDIASFDMVHFKTSQRDITATMARYLKKRSVKVLDEFRMHFSDSSKLYQYAVLADNAVAVPDSMFVMPSVLEESFDDFVAHVGLPFVLKGIHASKGDHNYLVHSKAEFATVCKQLRKGEVFAIAQRFIPNAGDYRVLVLGRRIYLVVHRNRVNDDTHLNNTSRGGSATLLDASTLPTSVQTASIVAAKVLDLGVAGVDMVQDTSSGVWYCLEVNDGPQIASGAFVHEKQQAFAKYMEDELRR